MTGKLRNHRLKKTWDFQKILKKRQKIYNENFVIFYERNQVRESSCRFGISVPQRVVKKVFLRNKYKRQTKHALLDLQRRKTGGWTDFKGWDFLIIIREEFTTKDFETKRNSLENLFNFFVRKVSDKYSITSKKFPEK